MQAVRILVVLGFMTPVAGFAAPTEEEQTRACSGDVMRLCSAHIPDRGRIRRCMAANHDQLSPSCKVVFDASVAAQPAVR